MSKAQIDVVDVLRIVAFIVGLALLFSGFIDLGSLPRLEVVTAMSTGGTALLKIILGAFLMALSIGPELVGMIITGIIKR